MFDFNLLVILLVDFHVYFGFFLPKRAHLKGSLENKGKSTKNFRGVGLGGRRPFCPLAPADLRYAALLKTRV